MIAHIQINEKSFGNTQLYSGLEFRVAAGEKVGLIGRNGTGKTTLFSIISGNDADFDGDVSFAKGLVVISSRQEHQDVEEKLVIDYILDELPEYASLSHDLETLPDKMNGKPHLIQRYSDALERFGVLGYYDVQSEVHQALETYQLPPEKTQAKLKELSGGQKRLIDLVKIQRSHADLALVDEPTNHMDYIAKESFIDWLQSTKEAVVVISHDRDVLKAVDRIIEIRDGQTDISNGNYDSYLRTNTTRITSEVNEFSVTQRRIENLKSDVIRFQRLKEKARNGSTIANFKRLENESRSELAQLQKLEKPSFWIDKESTQGLKTKLADEYDKHKARNIKIRTSTAMNTSNRLLMELKTVSLGYEKPLFKNISRQLREGDKLHIHGRNGVGKSTLAQAIIDSSTNQALKSTVYDGLIEFDSSTSIGVYEQELDPKFLPLSLSEAVEQAYQSKGVDCNDQLIRSLLSDYLFEPMSDGQKPLQILSGGQKARFQLISMLAGDPNVLILDEPTNHLDLPSIEELEDALGQYHGAIIYISHDSYFTKNIGGQTLQIEAS